MRRQLLLVRHGRSAHVHDGSWIDAAQARTFEEHYDAAPIRADDIPPPSLVQRARNAAVILTSDLARAVTSARALAPGCQPIISPLLRELRFDLPTWGPRLPLDVWDALHHAVWTVRLLGGHEYADTRRARDAAKWIDSQAAGAALTIAITHGGFRRLLAAQCTRTGWIPQRGVRRYSNWSAWEFSRMS
jgi:broad specificity phosphatase PhoE